MEVAGCGEVRMIKTFQGDWTLAAKFSTDLEPARTNIHRIVFGLMAEFH